MRREERLCNPFAIAQAVGRRTAAQEDQRGWLVRRWRRFGGRLSRSAASCAAAALRASFSARRRSVRSPAPPLPPSRRAFRCRSRHYRESPSPPPAGFGFHGAIEFVGHRHPSSPRDGKERRSPARIAIAIRAGARRARSEGPERQASVDLDIDGCLAALVVLEVVGDALVLGEAAQPARSSALIWTNASLPPSSGAMNRNPSGH